MSKAKSITLRLGPYEFEIVRQKESKGGDLYTTFPHSKKGLHLSVHKSGRMHLRGARDAHTGTYETDIRLRAEDDSLSANSKEVALDILENAFFTPSRYPNAFSFEIPSEYDKIDSETSTSLLKFDMATITIQFIRSIRPLTEDNVLMELNDQSNPRRIIGYDDPEAGFSILIPSPTPGGTPFAFSQKWLLERTRFGKELMKPMLEGIDKGLELSQEGLKEIIAREVDGPTIQKTLQEMIADSSSEEFMELLSVYETDKTSSDPESKDKKKRV
jgi:hypothetical protein